MLGRRGEQNCARPTERLSEPGEHHRDIANSSYAQARALVADSVLPALLCAGFVAAVAATW
jgi:hypothetical protein